MAAALAVIPTSENLPAALGPNLLAAVDLAQAENGPLCAIESLRHLD
jgi:hypothetical protein